MHDSNRLLLSFSCQHKSNIGLGEGGEDGDGDWPSMSPGDKPSPGRDWLDLISDANSLLSVQLLFTYLFTLLALRHLYKNYRRFIRSRQLFSLELVHSIPARTVMVTNLPNHLRGERALAEYFENMDLSVESVSVCREVGTLKALLDRRTKALLALEACWVKYVGNPSSVESYDPSDSVMPPLADVESSGMDGHSTGRLVVPHQKRPTLRVSWFGRKVDALEYLEAQFREADEKVKRWRKNGKFKATHVAFVTFEKMSSAVRIMTFALFLILKQTLANCLTSCSRFEPVGVHCVSRS
jgi:calcium permeable stress-gated cation channel